MEKNIYLPMGSHLEHYVTAIWEVVGRQNSHETILPQGVVEIVFNFAEAIQGILPYSNLAIEAPRCFIQGINTHLLHASYIGQHHLLGVRLHPHRVQDLLGILPAQLNNTYIDLTLIQPEFNQLWHQLIELPSFSKRVQLLENQLPRLRQTPSARLQRLSQLFLSDEMTSFQSVDHLARQVCYSSRQLNRVVHHLFGLSAEELTGYKKYLQAVKLIHHQNASLTAVALQAGFYDQAHFCRFFKSYSGMTPKQYSDHKSELPFHILS